MALQRLDEAVCPLKIHVPVVLVLCQGDPVISESMFHGRRFALQV